MQELEDGAVLARRYTLKRRIATGGMAETWLADDRQTVTRVVLKFVVSDRSDDAAARALLKREWRIASRLMHPNIVRVFEFHEEESPVFYSQQYLGETKLGVLAQTPPSVCLRPIAMLADALRYAHGKDVVHRDIKAENVLLDSRGLPCLIDFGVAAARGQPDIRGGGSAVAMSPAQKAGGEAASADDIYALGVLMHELLTGRPPGEGATVSPTLPGGEPMPQPVSALLNDMLAADGNARPDAQTVGERLAAAGYPPGAAPLRYVPGAAAADEIVEVSAPGERFKPAPSRTASAPIRAAAASQPDRSARLLYGGLAAAFVLLLAVVFVLPEFVNRSGTTPVADSPAPGVAEDGTPGDDESTPDRSAETPAFARRQSDADFGENLGDVGVNQAARIKSATDEALGDLLSRLERLRYRAIERWGGQPYLDAVDVYAEGDQAYVDKNYRLAGERYRQASRMLDPFFDRIDAVFRDTLEAAREAFAAGDHAEAVRLYDLAVSITPGNREAEAGLARAENLEAVINLTRQGVDFEKSLELEAARLAFSKALELDPAWQAAAEGLSRVRAAIKQMTFEQRMTEGFDALAAGDYASARAAFNAAKAMEPGSAQPSDGLLQVEQAVKLDTIRRLEADALALEAAEQWETAIGTYQDILNIDGDLQFAKEGLANARSRAALHSRLEAFISDPDQLSDQVTMQNATRLLLDVTRVTPMGPRLEDQKNELSRLLKRAATPLPVQLISDNQTSVAIFKVGRLGTFASRELELRPGVYVATGSRPGYRDVRVEFRVAPEDEPGPIVIQCEEAI